MMYAQILASLNALNGWLSGMSQQLQNLEVEEVKEVELETSLMGWLGPVSLISGLV